MAAKSSKAETPKRRIEGNRIHYICPKCGKELRIAWKQRCNYCIKCGQRIDFEAMENEWWTEWLVCQNREDAYRCTEKYKDITGYEFADPETFMDRNQKENGWWPKDLVFYFLKKQDYGRFLRWVAKEGPTRIIFSTDRGGCD